jgi:hypothetical protein
MRTKNIDKRRNIARSPVVAEAKWPSARIVSNAIARRYVTATKGESKVIRGLTRRNMPLGEAGTIFGFGAFFSCNEIGG